MFITSGKYYYSRGSVLVIVMIVVSAMTIVAFGLAYQTRIEMRLSKSSSQETKVWYLALSGIEACKAILSSKELTAGRTAKICRFYSVKECSGLFEQIKSLIDRNGEVAFWLKDENSFLDMNKSDSSVWEKLPGFTKEKRTCIMDWIDADSDTSSDGAEADYYEQLNSSYNCKNRPLVCLKELLFIKNISRSDHIGSILNGDIINADDIKIILNGEPTHQIPCINRFTVFGQEKINLNTVSTEILSALPGLDQQASNIISAFREGPDGLSSTDDDRVFETPEDILKLEGLTDLQKELLTQYCCFNSDTFRIFSCAKVTGQTCFLMATIKMTENKPQIISMERLL